MRIPVAAITLAAVISASAASAAESGLAAARTFYDDAQYARAIAVLDGLPAAEVTAEAHQYRALCLIALGRSDDAERAMASAVAADPHFRPDSGTVSPRVVSMFAATRRRLLPATIRQGFAAATALHRDGARALAVEQFTDLLRLLEDPALKDDPSLADLAVVADAFIELYRARGPEQGPPASAAPVRAALATPTPSGAPTVGGEGDSPIDLVRSIAETGSAAASSAAASGGAASGGTASSGAGSSSAAETSSAAEGGRVTAAYTPPVALLQDLPKWVPPDPLSSKRTFFGAITVVVDEQGRVIAAKKKRTIHPAYDPVVLAAARRWSYMPAFRDGLAIRSELTVEVQLNPPVE
jgi:hypothetical protein